jgi:hypothetical protein
VRLDGETYVWEADEMIALVGEHTWEPDREARIEAERERRRFTVDPVPPA